MSLKGVSALLSSMISSELSFSASASGVPEGVLVSAIGRGPVVGRGDSDVLGISELAEMGKLIESLS